MKKINLNFFASLTILLLILYSCSSASRGISSKASRCISSSSSACAQYFTSAVAKLHKNEFDSKNFENWAKSNDFHLLQEGVEESHSFKRVGSIIEGDFSPVLKKTNEDSSKLTFSPSGAERIYGNKQYIEFPNSTAMQTINPLTGKQREFVLTRGVRPYSVDVAMPSGSINPQNYVSDVLLFERVGDDYNYIHTILESNPESNFLFEDPRVSFIIDKKGKYKYFLSGTDYSPHVKNSKNPDVMNRYIQLEIDESGLPLPSKLNSKNKDKLFSNLSPSPKKVGADYLFIDAKNATIYQNEFGEVVVRTRMRPDFNNPIIKELAGDKEWKYAEQVFIFKNFQEFTKYDWNNALYDLFKASKKGKRVRPQLAQVILTGKQLNEMYKAANVMLEKGKGMGPGGLPVRLRREGNDIYLSDAKGAQENIIGSVESSIEKDFILKDGDVKYISFDHEIRYFSDQQDGSSFTKRHYSASIKLFDQRISKIEAYYADVIQPRTEHERGLKSGILDLQHVYPMGRTIVDDNNSGKKIVRVYAGASDAHTTVYDFDMMILLEELSKNSSQRASGQVYEISSEGK